MHARPAELNPPQDGTAILAQGWVALAAGVWAHPDYREPLLRAGFSDFRQVMNITADEYEWHPVSMRPNRPVIKFQLADRGEWLYLKRHTPPADTDSDDRSRRHGWEEWLRLQQFQQAGIPTQTAVGVGWSAPGDADPGSLLVTRELPGMALERYVYHRFKDRSRNSWQPDMDELVKQVATLTRAMHDAGFNHQDWYLGHIWATQQDAGLRLSVIDVQRAQYHRCVSLGRIIKDLAQLNFSADPHFFCDEDRLSFLRGYWGTEHFSWWQYLVMRLIRLKTSRIRRHTEKALGIPYEKFFDNKYW
jgi:hypothetical protein